MTKTKHSLLMSATALLLCFSMLIGTTFAWFTDSVTSSNNIIKSGTLKVKMEWKDAATTGKQTEYKDASTGAIFDSELWEPGFVDAKNIKISNIGTLALKYNINIAPDGDVSDLADVIEVYFAEGEIAVDRSLNGLTRVGTLTEILAGMPANMAGDLEADKNDTVTIALKMNENAGNEYQDKAIGEKFSVILIATQLNFEEDSIDKNYDDIEIPDKEEKLIEGNTYYYYNNGDVVLASVPYGNVGSTFAVPADVTILGRGDVYDGAIPVFSKSSPIEAITLPEGLEEIKARAITGVKTLTSINFPSTLKAIRAQALRQTGMDVLDIPANVEFIGDGAFRDMANLKTVTIAGNVKFENYAFRSCPNLETIYLLGDDVTFKGNMFATHTDDGNANGITIYVKNATVAARLYAAQTSAYGYEVKILGENADGSDAKEVLQVKNDAAFDEAVKNGTTAVVLSNGNYSMPDGDEVSLRGKELTIAGTTETVIDVSNVDERDQFVTGATLKFEGVTLNFGTALYMGFANTESLTYKNCVINGVQHLYGDSIAFDGCEINYTGEDYSIRTWGGKNVTFNNCTFNSAGKAILVYNQSCNLTVNDCIFNDNGTVSGKAAIEACNGDNGDNCVTHNIIVNNTVVNGFDANNSTDALWGNKNNLDKDHLNIVIDGVDVY